MGTPRQGELVETVIWHLTTCNLFCPLQLYAIVEFTSEDSALGALRHSETLTLGGNKLVVKPREMKTHPRPKKTKKGKQKHGLGEGEAAMETERSWEVGVLGGVCLPEGALERVGQAQTVR